MCTTPGTDQVLLNARKTPGLCREGLQTVLMFHVASAWPLKLGLRPETALPTLMDTQRRRRGKVTSSFPLTST